MSSFCEGKREGKKERENQRMMVDLKRLSKSHYQIRVCFYFLFFIFIFLGGGRGRGGRGRGECYDWFCWICLTMFL